MQAQAHAKPGAIQLRVERDGLAEGFTGLGVTLCLLQKESQIEPVRSLATGLSGQPVVIGEGLAQAAALCQQVGAARHPFEPQAVVIDECLPDGQSAIAQPQGEPSNGLPVTQPQGEAGIAHLQPTMLTLMQCSILANVIAM